MRETTFNPQEYTGKCFCCWFGRWSGSRWLNCRDGELCSNGFPNIWLGFRSVKSIDYYTFPNLIAQKAHLRGILVEYNHNNWNLEAIGWNAAVDIAVVVVNAASGEGHIEIDGNYGDRKNISLWHNGDELIKHVAEKVLSGPCHCHCSGTSGYGHG